MESARTLLSRVFLSVAVAAMASMAAAAQGVDSKTDGIWREHGYGLLLELRSGKGKLYEVTRVSCVPLAREINLNNYKDVRLNGNELTLYHRNGNVYSYTRQSSLPAACTNYAPTRDPEVNFEVLWNTFEENYAFFHNHNVDWQAAYKVYRPQVNKDTTDDELFEIFRQMLAPLQDYHVSVDAGEKEISHSGYKLRDRAEEVWDLIRSKYLKGNYNTRLHQLSYGKLDDKTGYIRIRRMSGFTMSRDSDADTQTLLEKALDEILDSFQGVTKVVLDVRFNPGGSDPPARYLAERFTDRKRLAYSKCVRDGGYTDLTTPKVEFFVEPKGRSQFTKKVVVLTNGACGSACEIFMECVQALPHVTIVGENSEGAFSDNLMKTLPNGWRISLSNEVYYNHKGICLEGPGVPPDVRVPLTLQDLKEGRDLALEKAMSEPVEVPVKP